MQYVNLGRTGLMVSRLCFGCLAFGTRDVVGWALDEEAAQLFFRRALDAGINFFDTADAYSVGASEEITGRALLRYAGRHNALIAIKIHVRMGPGPNDRGLSRQRVFAAVDACL
ncbi:MAG: aldo/keto reductase, partial [Alphaproteobacteria bacterium]|nr:aldo/keto reductase [Alphaproteobacteria bacterium]